MEVQVLHGSGNAHAAELVPATPSASAWVGRRMLCDAQYDWAMGCVNCAP
jgi:hypothetical protein